MSDKPYDRRLFEPQTPEDLLKRENEIKELNARIASVVKGASECVNDPKFKKYREDFENMKKEAFSKLKDPIIPDPIQDAHYLRSCIIAIVILDELLERPQEDLRRKEVL